MDELEEYILHMAELALYANTLAEEIAILSGNRMIELDGMIRDAGSIRSRRKYESLLEKIESSSHVLVEAVSELLSGSMNAVADKQMKWLSKVVPGARRPRSLMDKLMLATYDGRNSIGDYPALLASRVDSPACGAAKSMYLFSATPDAASEGMTEHSPSIIRGIHSDVPTIVDASARTTERIVYEGDDRVDDLVWVSTLDGRTCLVCGSRNGARYPKGKAPMCPAHHRCRCILAPCNDGLVPPSFPKWLSRQTEDMQLRVLGRARFNLYKDGMSFDRFVSDGRKLRLDEL